MRIGAKKHYLQPITRFYDFFCMQKNHKIAQMCTKPKFFKKSPNRQKKMFGQNKKIPDL
jgi:hypothetical protein